jgi:hypothetical protein
MSHLGEEEKMMCARAEWGHSPSKLGAHPPAGQGDRL